jgi:hypothetical protein
MLCAELEQMEAQIDDILTALEKSGLTEQEREALERTYAELSHAIKEHQTFGHHGGPCFEE